MGVAMCVGNGDDLTVDTVQAVVENGARQTALTTVANLKAAGIPYHFVDGSTWPEGRTGKHAQQASLQADMDDFVSLIMKRLRHP
ncbi:hypothetical protein ACFO9E_00175 [Streptomyces maoxianensis]|uniref:Uncharacterized protein n=1 Tax=Streptomyces maoxianensis TaxID=1459942 RepID=A0ABV9FWA5_9ACTN